MNADNIDYKTNACRYYLMICFIMPTACAFFKDILNLRLLGFIFIVFFENSMIALFSTRFIPYLRRVMRNLQNCQLYNNITVFAV
jgi:hypothetical protein